MIKDLFAKHQPVISFEFFPPKSDEGAEKLFRTVQELGSLSPGFVSVTYGAGGSTRRKTLDVVARIKKETGIETMAHLTCVGHDRDEIKVIIDKLVSSDVVNVLALRGDPPKDEDSFVPHKNGFAHATELVAFIRELGAPLCIGAACYPEGHPETPDLERDIAHLKTKVDAGVDFLVTQLFFDNAYYFSFVDKARQAGICVPISPGIWPITNYKQIQKIADLCGAKLPQALALELDSVRDSLEAVAGVGISHALDQCRELLAKGAPGLHFYTLNKSPATRAIHARLMHKNC